MTRLTFFAALLRPVVCGARRDVSIFLSENGLREAETMAETTAAPPAIELRAPKPNQTKANQAKQKQKQSKPNKSKSQSQAQALDLAEGPRVREERRRSTSAPKPRVSWQAQAGPVAARGRRGRRGHDGSAGENGGRRVAPPREGRPRRGQLHARPVRAGRDRRAPGLSFGRELWPLPAQKMRLYRYSPPRC